MFDFRYLNAINAFYGKKNVTISGQCHEAQHFLITVTTPGYHRQQNKWYPKRCLLAHFEAIHPILAVVNSLVHNNKSQICYCGQMCVLQLTEVFLTPLGGTIYFAVVGTLSNVRMLSSNVNPYYDKKVYSSIEVLQSISIYLYID